MENTAAAEDKSFVLAVDATAASFIAGELTAVGTPLQVDRTIPEPKEGRFSRRLTSHRILSDGTKLEKRRWSNNSS